MAPGGKRYDTKMRWPCWTLGHTGLTTGSNLSSTSPMLESRPVGHIFKRIRSLGIYVQSTDFNVSNYIYIYIFFPPKKTVGMKSPQWCAGISLQSLQVFVSGLELGVQWGQRGIYFMLVDFKRDWMHNKHADSLKKTLILGKIEGMRRSWNRGWDGWMASPSRWTWAWASSGSWQWIGKPGMLQSMVLQRDRHNWRTEPNWINWEQRLISLIASNCWLAT